MAAFGENLRRERDLRGVSLAEISQATKIGARLLDAIETERFDRLPGGVFNVAFVRQYARYLGLDEDKIVAEFLSACGPGKEQASQQRDAAIGALKQMVTEPPAEPGRWLPMMIAAVLLMLGALAVGGWRIWRGSSPDTVKPPPRAVTTKPSGVPTAPTVTPSVEPSQESDPPHPADATSPAVPTKAERAERKSARSEKGVNLELQSTERCTIHVSIDGRPEWFAVMPRAGRRTLKGDHIVQLTVDDAAALLVTRNGEIQPPLGGRGESKTLTFRAGR
jgi:cytoskeletal protein RodZ